MGARNLVRKINLVGVIRDQEKGGYCNRKFVLNLSNIEEEKKAHSLSFFSKITQLQN